MAILHNQLGRWIDEQITKVLVQGTLKPEDVGQLRAGSWVSAVAHVEFHRQRVRADAQQFIENYGIPAIKTWWEAQRHPSFGRGKHKGPKWGQPGRRRRRKMRLAARWHNEEMQRQRAECLKLFARMQGDLQRRQAEVEEKRLRAAFEALKNPPTGPTFTTP